MRIREIARQNYVTQKGDRELLAFRAISASQRQIKQEFGTGIISSILISLMIKLAVKYIEGWIEDKLFSYNVPQQFEEAK
jgi:Trp operon repressor